ncbi:protein of unknown function [Caldanaerobius fijiensis DSM 17918]|uniref:DUF4363 family protein n=1 Tax=Caldanaerobius fijiensis DSM 17918 TaxID=1121256 RepID=A0A1M5CTS3_9THEO|nr:DUF4363 family protein [Caldanaerobius fijiensis]SHF58067.1 protein of unknown function [Caldanaerobius fijiensis DSM 17918]
MRHILIVMLVFALIVVGDISAYKYLYTTSTSLNAEAASMSDYVEKEKWSSAINSAKALKKNWDKRKFIWSILIDHKEIDDIERGMTRAENYIKAKNKPMALAEVRTLERIIKHIPDNQLFSIENIL